MTKVDAKTDAKNILYNVFYLPKLPTDYFCQIANAIIQGLTLHFIHD